MKRTFSVAYHPQSHGQVENVIKQVWKLLKPHVSQHQRDWDQHLDKVEAALRFSPNKTTGISPFKMQTGYEARLPIDVQLPTEEEELAAQTAKDPKERQVVLEKELKELFNNVKTHVKKMQEKMKGQ